MSSATVTNPGTASPFALTPGQLNAGTIIQMDTKAGREMDNKVISLLKYKHVSESASTKNRGDIILIKDNENDPRNFITEYGCLTTRTLEADADTWVDKETRKAQNNHMMVECMMASIT